MASFTDNKSRNWTVALTIASVRDVKAELDGLDLLGILNKGDKTLERLAADIGLAVDVLFVLLRRDLAAQNVTDVDFGESLTGDAIDQAVDALLEAIADFFRKDQRAAIRALVEKIQQTQSQATSRMARVIQKPETQAAIEKALDKAEQEATAEIAAIGGN